MVLVASTTGCARTPTSHSGEATAANVATPAAETHLGCLDALHAYRFSGTMSLRVPSGANTGQIGSLDNLLQDVRFDGSFLAPDSSTITLHFAGSGQTQTLETERIGGNVYVRNKDGSWSPSGGTGPILSALSQLDPKTLCDTTLAQVDVSGVSPVSTKVSGIDALLYRLGPEQLANSPGFFGRGERGQNPNASTRIDVWEAKRDGYPVRLTLESSFGEGAGGAGMLQLKINVIDPNGSDITIQAPS